MVLESATTLMELSGNSYATFCSFFFFAALGLDNPSFFLFFLPSFYPPATSFYVNIANKF